MKRAVKMLRDIALEAHTTSMWLEHGDCCADSFDYIEKKTLEVIDMLEDKP